MTILSILSTDEIAAFESPPVFTAEERKYYFALPDWAKALITKLETPTSRIGFILQLGYFLATSKFYSKDMFYPDDMAFVQKRFGTDNAWHAPGYSRRMSERHRALIRTKRGYMAFSPTALAVLVEESASAVEKQMRLKDIFGRLLDVLEQRRIAVPHYSTLAGIITSAFRKYEKRMLTQLASCLTEADKQLLDNLLAVNEQQYTASDKQAVTLKRPRVTLLKKFHQAARPGKIRENIADLLAIQDLFTRFAPVCGKLKLTRPVIEHYATITIKVQRFQIERRNELRYLYLLCFIIHQYYTLNDLLIEKLVKVVQTANNKAKKAQQDTYYAAREERLLAAGELAKASESANQIVEQATRIVFSESVPDSEKIAKLRTLLRRDNEAILEESWDDILRFMATIILRETPASQLFQRLNSNARKHPLYKALSEFGQIIETSYILRNIDEVEIRQAAEKELNKMEHINNFNDAVFKENNHVMQQETREMQLIADHCRRLIQNNIIGYNYLLRSQQVIDTPEGKQREALIMRLRRSSMAIWYHIHMDGEYDFSDEKVNTITPFPLSKILDLKIDVKQEEELQPFD